MSAGPTSGAEYPSHHVCIKTLLSRTLAVSEKLNIRAFDGLVVPYPSYAEAGKRAATTYFNRGLTRPRTRRIMASLRRMR
jgi:hypothetical protein